MDMNDPLIAEQIPLNQAVSLALLQAMPDGWDAGELHIQWQDELSTLNHKVVCPHTGDAAPVTEAIVGAALALTEHGRKFGLPWVSAIFRMQRLDDGRWQAGASFTQSLPENQSPPPLAE